ncbi:BQ2448_7640 [Microbotryum intermedium]|uniref:BQ2448_7640 protein n=1 Tax=Microbotryum intermedium TaxID=269621 RepID=A0A238FQY8_9BASI|nr:BQ2448_7640 [Microbotryum intermedium]
MVLSTPKRRSNLGSSTQASTSASISSSRATSLRPRRAPSLSATKVSPVATNREPQVVRVNREAIDLEQSSAPHTARSSTTHMNGHAEPTPTTTLASTSSSGGVFFQPPNPIPFAPSQQPPSSKALGKRRQTSPEPPSIPVPQASLVPTTSASQPPRTSRKGGRKRIRPSPHQTHSINGPKLAPGAGVKSRRKKVLPEATASADGTVPSLVVQKDRRKEFLKKIRDRKGDQEEESWTVEEIRSVKAALLEQIQAELDQVKKEYKTLSDELVKAQIEESVWNNVKKETLVERTHLRYLNKGQLMNLLTSTRPA